MLQSVSPRHIWPMHSALRQLYSARRSCSFPLAQIVDSGIDEQNVLWCLRMWHSVLSNGLVLQ